MDRPRPRPWPGRYEARHGGGGEVRGTSCKLAMSWVCACLPAAVMSNAQFNGAPHVWVGARVGKESSFHPTHPFGDPGFASSHSKVTHPLARCHDGPRPPRSRRPPRPPHTLRTFRTRRKRGVQPSSRETWRAGAANNLECALPVPGPTRKRPRWRSTVGKRLPETRQKSRRDGRCWLSRPRSVMAGFLEVRLHLIALAARHAVMCSGGVVVVGLWSGGGRVSLVSGGCKRQRAGPPARPVVEATQPQIGLCDNTATAGSAIHWLPLPLRPSALPLSTGFVPFVPFGGSASHAKPHDRH